MFVKLALHRGAEAEAGRVASQCQVAWTAETRFPVGFRQLASLFYHRVLQFALAYCLALEDPTAPWEIYPRGSSPYWRK